MIEKGLENSCPERLLIMFVKEPLPGRVKTRLGKSVGNEEAARRYRVLVTVLLKQLQGLKGTRLRVCYAPDDADEAVRMWLLPLLKEMGTVRLEGSVIHWSGCAGGVDFSPQGGGDLGDRLQRAFSTGFTDGFEKVAAIGSDCVDLSASWVNAAFRRISPGRELVYGPSPDGGYGYLGLGEQCDAVFQNIEWSHEKTLVQTLAAASRSGLGQERLSELRDIDDAEDWAALMDGLLGAKIEKLLEEMPL